MRPVPTILESVGNTPLVQLRRLFKGTTLKVYAKLELLNPGGSMKDRSALSMLRGALADGSLRPGGTVIESSSGNLGVGLAQACAVLGLKFVCIVDPKATEQNVGIIKAYGAEVHVVEQPTADGSYLHARIARVQTLLSQRPGSIWTNQYANLKNPAAHHQTMQEIHAALGDGIDFVFGAVSTCGTMRGVTEYARQAQLRTVTVAVDSVGSGIFDGSRSGARRFSGHGAARRPELFYEGVADRTCHVTDLECVVGCRRLALDEGILAGASSGGVLAAALRSITPSRSTTSCVLILADRGERYLDTIYDDRWIANEFGPVSELWNGPGRGAKSGQPSDGLAASARASAGEPDARSLSR